MSEELFPALLDWAVAARAMPGEAESGDLHLVVPIPHGVLVGVVDGLGHGPEATAAAQVATGILRSFAHESLPALFQRCHEGLSGTRGVVMSLASIDTRDDSLTWLGAGNVECVLFRAHVTTRPQRVTAMLRGGVVGDQLPRLSAVRVSIMPNDTLIMATDGIRGDFAQRPFMSSSPQQMANRILAVHGKETDDALVLVARYLGGPR